VVDGRTNSPSQETPWASQIRISRKIFSTGYRQVSDLPRSLGRLVVR
jgi:hypothetical protein